MQRPPIEENIPNIKTLAEQMVRINFGYQLDELEQNKLPESINSKMTFQKKNTFNIKNPNQKINKKLIRNDSDLSNLSSNKSKIKSNQSNTKSDISEFGKNQDGKDGNSNIINTNANLNTNINTTTNLNSRLNTNAINNNNNIINTNIDNNKKDDDLYSDKNSQIYPINENSSNMSNSNNKDDNKDKKEKSEDEKENENENTIININESQVIKKDPKVTVEIVNPVLLKKIYEHSFEENNNKMKINNKINKSKINKSTLYEREMRNLKRKNNKLAKKREQLYYDKLKHLKPGPEIDPYSEEIIEGKEIYVPIDKRAAKLHSLKISQRILNEENNKIKQKEKEDEELKKDISRNKIFDQDEWDSFIERQYLWKDELEYKKKAAQIYKNNENKKNYFKPKINSKSKSIIQDIQYGNDKVIDEVFVRLYNDFQEHKERQKLRNDQSLPTFKPKIYKNSSQKNLNIKYNLKVPNKSETSPLISIGNNNKMKKKYSLVSSTKKIVNKKKEKAKSEKLFCDLYYNNIEKYLNNLNNIKSNKIQNTANKTQGVTQPTNNTHTNANYTDINTDLINSKYIILEKPEKKIKKNHSQPQIKSKIPFLPLNIKKMIDKNCNEENDEEENNNINNNYKFGITEHSNYEDGQSNFEENSKYYNVNNNENEESEDSNNLKMDPNDNECTKKIFSILNNNNSSSMKLIEKFNDYEKGKKYYGQSQNETINSDDSKLTDNNLYKLNVRDSTPQLIKQDIIMGNKDYSDFFDIPDMSEDN